MTAAAALPTPPAARLDRQRVERWTAAIGAGDEAVMRSDFAAIGARGPAIVWRPPVERPGAPQLRFLLRYWLDLRGARPMPLATEIDALEMRPALGYIMLVDVMEGGRDFRYRLYGSIIAAVSGIEMTGKLVTNHPASPYVVEFALAGYRAALARGEPLLTEHGPPTNVNTHAWHSLVLPLAGGDGKINRFLVGNLPIARNGQPITQRL
jgi:PAS domain-containing protein